MSATDDQSCNTYNLLDQGKPRADNLKISLRAKTGTVGTRNSPTVLIAGFQMVQFWD